MDKIKNVPWWAWIIVGVMIVVLFRQPKPKGHMRDPAPPPTINDYVEGGSYAAYLDPAFFGLGDAAMMPLSTPLYYTHVPKGEPAVDSRSGQKNVWMGAE